MSTTERAVKNFIDTLQRWLYSDTAVSYRLCST